MSIHLQIYEYKKSVQDEKDRKEGKVVKEEEHKQGELTDSEMKSLIYSLSRQVFKSIQTIL